MYMFNILAFQEAIRQHLKTTGLSHEKGAEAAGCTAKNTISRLMTPIPLGTRLDTYLKITNWMQMPLTYFIESRDPLLRETVPPTGQVWFDRLLLVDKLKDRLTENRGKIKATAVLLGMNGAQPHSVHYNKAINISMQTLLDTLNYVHEPAGQFFPLLVSSRATYELAEPQPAAEPVVVETAPVETAPVEAPPVVNPDGLNALTLFRAAAVRKLEGLILIGRADIAVHYSIDRQGLPHYSMKAIGVSYGAQGTEQEQFRAELQGSTLNLLRLQFDLKIEERFFAHG